MGNKDRTQKTYFLRLRLTPLEECDFLRIAEGAHARVWVQAESSREAHRNAAKHLTAEHWRIEELVQPPKEINENARDLEGQAEWHFRQAQQAGISTALFGWAPEFGSDTDATTSSKN